MSYGIRDSQINSEVPNTTPLTSARPAQIGRTAFITSIAVLLLVLAIATLTPGNQAAPGGATITFRKVFKSSYPEFVEIKLDAAGKGTYDIRQLSDDASPQTFQIGTPIAQKIFDLAGQLHNFQGLDLEVHRRIASLGDKTFRYDNGAESHETTFNYTMNATATSLLNIFDNISRQETDLDDLQRTMRYDHLGVNDVVGQIQKDYDAKLLPEPERFLPLLDQLAADEKYINVARDNARTLAGHIRYPQ